MTASVTIENDALTQKMSGSNWKLAQGHRVHLLISKDEEGGFSAVALNLPGAGSCGETEVEAVSNAKEAIRGVLESYKASGGTVPWKDTSSEEIPAGTKQKWIILDA